MRRSVGKRPPHTPMIRVREVKRQETRLLSISWHTGFCPGMDKVWVSMWCVCMFVVCNLWRLDMIVWCFISCFSPIHTHTPYTHRSDPCHCGTNRVKHLPCLWELSPVAVAKVTGTTTTWNSRTPFFWRPLQRHFWHWTNCELPYTIYLPLSFFLTCYTFLLQILDRDQSSQCVLKFFKEVKTVTIWSMNAIS